MKIRKTLLLLGLILPLVFSSCGLFDGTKGCDCPKFGQETDQNTDEPTDISTASSLE